MDGLASKAMAAYQEDTEGELGSLTEWTAELVQTAVLAMLISGSHLPPPRLSVLRTALHPSRVGEGPCPDPNCKAHLRGVTCLGNRFEVGVAPGEGGAPPSMAVTYVAVHHKNSSREGHSSPMSFSLPHASVLTDLVGIHIKEGHAVLSAGAPKPSPFLFRDRQGRPFTPATLCYWWGSLMAGQHGPVGGPFPDFTPSRGRNLFVSSYMKATGLDAPMDWAAAATYMGNSLKQWREYYGPKVHAELLRQRAQLNASRWPGLRRSNASEGPAAAEGEAPAEEGELGSQGREEGEQASLGSGTDSSAGADSEEEGEGGDGGGPSLVHGGRSPAGSEEEWESSSEEGTTEEEEGEWQEEEEGEGQEEEVINLVSDEGGDSD